MLCFFTEKVNTQTMLTTITCLIMLKNNNYNQQQKL